MGIRKYLAARNCSIPQLSSDSRKLNVIRGEFFVKGEISWAALCSARGNSVILVFRNRHDTRPGELAKAPDTNYVGTDGAHTYYLREIRPVNRRFILDAHRAFGGPKPPPIDHQGIDDAFLEKASVTYYRHKGKWLQLQGAD